MRGGDASLREITLDTRFIPGVKQIFCRVSAFGAKVIDPEGACKSWRHFCSILFLK